MPQETSSVKLLVDFANTYDVDHEEAEQLGSPEALREWLVDHELLAPETQVTSADVDREQVLRNGLRQAVAAHHDGAAVVLPDLDAMAARFPLRVAFDLPIPRIVPMGDPVERALGAVLVAVQQMVADDTWSRLKLCRADTCQWAFFDESKNQRRSWCSMAVCGNRQKTRAYRQRRQGG